MPSLHERTRNNVRAGIFVTVAIALALATVLVLSDVWQTLSKPFHQYTVTFDVASGVQNISPGAAVRVGGMQMGKVKQVRPMIADGVFQEVIEIDFSLDSRVRLYDNATVMITSALIGEGANLEIFNLGGDPAEPSEEADAAERTPAVLADGGVLEGTPGIGALAGILGPANAVKAEMIIDDFKATSGNIRQLTQRINQDDWPRWADDITEVMSWATSATERVDDLLIEGRGLFADTRGVVAENRESIGAIVTNAQSTSEDMKSVMSRVRTETVDKVHALLDTGQEGLNQASAVLKDLRMDYGIWATDVTETLAAARLTAQQLKLTSIEIRRSPWKLLYRPGRSELEHELLYEAARSFALAGSDLKASSHSARRLLEHHRDELDEETVKRINEFLGDSLERYSNAQQRLVDVLLTK